MKVCKILPLIDFFCALLCITLLFLVFDVEIMKEMGELGILGSTIKGECKH